MFKYIAWTAFLAIALLTVVIFKKSVSTTTNKEVVLKKLKRKLKAFASFFFTALIFVGMFFMNFGAIRSYFFSVLPEQTISSAYVIIKVLFDTSSVTCAMNSLCVYFVIGSSISAACVMSVNMLTKTLILGADYNMVTEKNEYRENIKQSVCNRISFISLRKIRI